MCRKSTPKIAQVTSATKNFQVNFLPVPKSSSMRLSPQVVILDLFAAVSELLVFACFRSSGRGGSTLIPAPVSTRNLRSLFFSIRYKTCDLCDTSAMTRDASSQ